MSHRDVTLNRKGLWAGLEKLFLHDSFVMLLIALNAVLLFLSSFPDNDHDFFHTAGDVVTLLFLLEVIVKIRHFGARNYFSVHENKFDFIVVIISTFFLITPFVVNISNTDITLLRTARIIKIVRVLKFVPNRDQLYKGIHRAIKASAAVFLLLFILIFIFSLLGNMFFSSTLPDSFGDPLKSMYSIFSVVFMVEGWNDITSQAIANNMENAYWLRAFIMFVLVIGGFLGVSLANAIFVDEMVMDNNDQLQNQLDSLLEINKQQNALISSLAQEVRQLKQDKKP